MALCRAMQIVLARRFSALPAGASVPEWVHVCPAGSFSGADGRGPFTLADAAAVIRASMAAGKLPIDETHATDLAAPKGLPAPARGWIVSMEARDDGIWGRVEWTGSGRTLLEDHAYRGISPVFVSEKASGRVVRILRASLTNDPNLPLTTLHSHQGTDMDFMAKIRKALGLADDASEDAILAAVTAAAGAQSAHAADLKTIAAAAGLAGDPDAAKLVTHLQARSAEGDPKKLAATVVELQAQLTTLQTDRARELAERAIDAAIADGKPVKPLRDHFIQRHQKDPAGVQKELDALPSLHGGGLKPRKEVEGGATIDADEAEVISAMGLDPKAYAETKKLLTTEAL